MAKLFAPGLEGNNLLCAQDNYCKVNSLAAAPACGATSYHLLPMPLSEVLCPRLAAGQLEYVASNRRAGLSPDLAALPSEHLAFFTGSAHLDLALNVGTARGDVAGHFDLAKTHLEEAASIPNATMDVPFKAQLLNTYMPAFQERATGTLPSQETMRFIYTGLGRLMDQVRKYPVGDYRQTSLLSRLATHMLLLRQGCILYPANGRESQGSHRDVKSRNHLAYLRSPLANASGYHKVAVRLNLTPVKTKGHVSRDVLHLSYRDLVAFTSSGTPDREMQLSFQHLQAEAGGSTLPATAEHMLDRITAALGRAISDHTRLRHD